MRILEGWKLVPIQPTPSMVNAAINRKPGANPDITMYDDIYRAMLSTAPTSPKIEFPKVPEVTPFPPNGRTAPIDYFLDRMLDHADSHNSLVLWTAIKFINDIRKYAHSHDAALSAAPTPPEVDGPLYEALVRDGTMLEKGWFSGNEVTDGCDYEGFKGGCDRAGHTVSACPNTSTEVKPVAWLGISGNIYTREHYPDDDMSAFTPLYTSPPSPKAEWSADGEPLNLDAAATSANSLFDYLLQVHPEFKNMIGAIQDNLRKFLGES